MIRPDPEQRTYSSLRLKVVEPITIFKQKRNIEMVSNSFYIFSFHILVGTRTPILQLR